MKQTTFHPLLRLTKIMAAATLLVASSSALAAATWTFQAAGCTASLTACAATQSNEVGTAKITQAAAYATTGTSGTTFALATLTNQGTSSGFGVTAAGEVATSPNHAMDNSGATELIVLKFDKDVILDKVVLGWISSVTSDADISLLRWAGGAAPNLASAVATKTVTSLASTWSLVGNYDGARGATDGTDVPIDVNPLGLSSSWWIVSAYNVNYGGNSLNNTVADYMKVLAVISQSPSTPGVPEPGSLALMGAALVGLMATRRKQKSVH